MFISFKQSSLLFYDETCKLSFEFSGKRFRYKIVLICVCFSVNYKVQIDHLQSFRWTIHLKVEFEEHKTPLTRLLESCNSSKILNINSLHFLLFTLFYNRDSICFRYRNNALKPTPEIALKLGIKGPSSSFRHLFLSIQVLEKPRLRKNPGSNSKEIIKVKWNTFHVWNVALDNPPELWFASLSLWVNNKRVERGKCTWKARKEKSTYLWPGHLIVKPPETNWADTDSGE